MGDRQRGQREVLKIAVILGTRPEIIKMSQVIRELKRRGLDYFVLHTGQRARGGKAEESEFGIKLIGRDRSAAGSIGDSEDISQEDVTFVIPTLNESEAIGKVLDELKREGYTNILVVDGYSHDGTLEIAGEKGVVVVLQHGKGKTGALKMAMERVRTPYILVMDGDYTYDPMDVKRLLNHGSRYAHVIGVRDRTNIRLLHRFGNWVITGTFNILMGVGLSDVCSGMYLLKTEVARELDLKSKGFAAEIEIAAQTATEYSITEVPIGYRRRIGKRKLSTWRHGFGILFSIIGLAGRYNPVLLFSAVSALSIIPAVTMLAWVVFRQLTAGVWHSGWALLGVMLLLFASQSLAVATLSILLKRMEKRIVQRLERK